MVVGDTGAATGDFEEMHGWLALRSYRIREVTHPETQNFHAEEKIEICVLLETRDRARKGGRMGKCEFD